MKADLHVHSQLSDCSESRDTILKKAVEMQLTHLAFTEHDTTMNSDECEELGKQYGITLIKGIEISAFDFETKKKAHILGYRYQTTNHIEALCKPILERRHENCIKQIRILKELGYQIEVEDIFPLAPGGIIYKQHILDYLMQTGQSETMFGKIYKEIFKQGGPCDFDITYVSAKDAVRAITADGGVAVLAHPLQQDNLGMVESLVAEGLKGLEYQHVSAKNRIEEVAECAKEYGLLLSGGSDYHGRYESVSAPLGSFLSTEAFVEQII